jgi:hypothetical protein
MDVGMYVCICVSNVLCNSDDFILYAELEG